MFSLVEFFLLKSDIYLEMLYIYQKLHMMIIQELTFAMVIVIQKKILLPFQ